MYWLYYDIRPSVSKEASSSVYKEETSSSSEVSSLRRQNEQLLREVAELREANERIRAELTDKHDRQIYQLNEKLVGAYREIKNMATEIATLRYELNCK